MILRDLEDAGNNIKAGAKTVASKNKKPNRNLGLEYDKEKMKDNVG